MPNIKISQMSQATSLTGEELIPIVQEGTNKTVTPNKLKEGLATTKQLENKVDKDGSKVLSDLNFTTTLKNKLDGIEALANKYTHPTNHPASIITQDTTHRFVTDTEKTTWNNKLNTLVSSTNIKTINGHSLLGEGNIEIQGGSGGGISDAPSDGKKYVRQNANWVEETTIDISNFATKTELDSKANTSDLSNYVTTVNAETTYAKKIDIPSLDGYLQTTVADSKYQPKGDYALKSDIPDISQLATKEELSVKLDKTEASSTYATKTELGNKLDASIYNSEKANFATKADIGDINTILDTINGEVI